MAIELYVEPRRTYTWDQFREQKPAFSIALDGIVHDSTRRDTTGPHANFDHHSGVDRLATRCTASQVYMDINMGLFQTFREDGVPTARVYVNDPDEDTCLAWWLVKNFEQVEDHANSRINRLVNCEDLLDSTAGAYPLGDTKMRRTMAWIFEPYNSARFEGRLPTMDAKEMKTVMEAVEARIDEYVHGNPEELGLEGHYERIGGGKGWTFVKETGPASRMAMYNDGIDAFIAVVSEKDDGSFVYTLGRKSVWIPFDLSAFYERLNHEEQNLVTDQNKWGGSDTIGGSPRETGSRISPEKLQEIINELETSNT